jgi:hypothetical protein
MQKAPEDAIQLSLFGDSADDSQRRKLDDLDKEIKARVSAKETHSAKAAAREQEALLEKIIKEKKGNKPKKRS